MGQGDSQCRELAGELPRKSDANTYCYTYANTYCYSDRYTYTHGNSTSTYAKTTAHAVPSTDALRMVG